MIYSQVKIARCYRNWKVCKCPLFGSLLQPYYHAAQALPSMALTTSTLTVTLEPRMATYTQVVERD